MPGAPALLQETRMIALPHAITPVRRSRAGRSPRPRTAGSRDDAGKFLPACLKAGLYEHDPFRSIDQKGVGLLLAMAVDNGRTVRPGMERGVCGEHGGDPASVAFFHRVGLDDVSCSPYRVPIARLAAAQEIQTAPRESGA